MWERAHPPCAVISRSEQSGRFSIEYPKRQAAMHGAFSCPEQEYETTLKLLGLMIHPDLHKPMPEALEDYAMFFITALFCTKADDGRAAGRCEADPKAVHGRPATKVSRNYYSDGLLEIARKKFKTFTSGVIFVLAMVKLPKFSRLFSVAPDLKLSSELKIAIKKIIKSSPLLEPYFRIMRTAQD